MQQQTRSEIVHIACRIGNENCATQVTQGPWARVWSPCSPDLLYNIKIILSNWTQLKWYSNFIVQWTHVMTPTGVCNVLRLDYLTEDQAENTLRWHIMTLDILINNKFKIISLVMAVNKSDWSYGWHGHRAGLALYYFDETILLNEHHELRS